MNGVDLTPQNVRREAIFIVGAKMVEAKIAEFFVDEWMEHQIKEGRDPKDFEVSEEKIVSELKGHVAEFQQKNPGVEFWEAVRSLTGLDKEGYMKQRRKTELFHKVFFPDRLPTGPTSPRRRSWPRRLATAVSSSGRTSSEELDRSEDR